MTRDKIMTRPSDYLKKGWCQDLAALDATGEKCAPDAPEAASWCLAGAVYVSTMHGEITDNERFSLLSAILDATGLCETYFNDAPGRTQQECINVMLKAEKEVLDATK